MRFVNATAANRVPSTRCWSSACDDTSIATVCDRPVAHPREQRLQVGRLGRGVLQRHDRAVDARLDRADHAGPVAVGARDRLEQVRRARLPVRAGDAEHAQRARRVAVEARAQRAEHAAHRVDAHLRHVDGERSARRGSATAPGRDRGRRVVVTVAARAGDAAEQRAGRRLAAVVHDRRRRRFRSRLGPRGGGRATRRSSRRSCSSTVLLGVLGRVGRQAIGGRSAPTRRRARRLRRSSLALRSLPDLVACAACLALLRCAWRCAIAARERRRRAAPRTSCPPLARSPAPRRTACSARSVGRDAVLLQRELHDLGEHRRRDLAAVAQVVLVEHDERREPRVVGRREADERRHRRRVGVAAGRRAPSSRFRSCPRRRSPGSPRTRRCRSATTPSSICVITVAVFVRHDARARRARRPGGARPSASIVASSRCGGRVTPPFAIVVNASSICMPVTATP